MPDLPTLAELAKAAPVVVRFQAGEKPPAPTRPPRLPWPYLAGLLTVALFAAGLWVRRPVAPRGREP